MRYVDLGARTSSIDVLARVRLDVDLDVPHDGLVIAPSPDGIVSIPTVVRPSSLTYIGGLISLEETTEQVRSYLLSTDPEGAFVLGIIPRVEQHIDDAFGIAIALYLQHIVPAVTTYHNVSRAVAGVRPSPHLTLRA